jgi:oligopeptide/dipeptide ABC transporter ATP-binding protein
MSQVRLNQEAGPLLVVRDLSVTFRKERGFLGRETKETRAVDHVSFELYPSEVLSIVGESGSGKTTIARCITGLTTPTSGTILYTGKDVTKLRGRELVTYRKDVQITFQDPFGSLIPFQNVLDFVSTPIRRLAGESDPVRIKETAVSLLDEVGLVAEEVTGKLPHQLSGGERQRVNLARALASHPKILVADEPVTMLDASQRLNMLLLLKELQKRRGLSILMVTHDLATAKAMQGRTMVMYLGKMFEIGVTAEILSVPFHPYTDLLLASVPRIAFGQPPVDVGFATIEESEELHRGCIFRNRCKYATEVCAIEEPPLMERSSKHFVACHNWLNGPSPPTMASLAPPPNIQTRLKTSSEISHSN